MAETYISRPKEIEEITWMELHIAAPYLRIPEHLLDLLQKKETVPYFLTEQSFINLHKILSHVRRGKMEFIVNHKQFTQALSEVNKAISTKSLIPILSGIKITADQSGITLITSNSNIFIEKFIPVLIEDEKVATILKAGTIVVPAKYFIEIIKKMPSDIAIKSKNEQIIKIQSEEITLSLNGFPADEFPNVPLIDNHAEIKVETEQLIEVFKQTVFAVAKMNLDLFLLGCI